MMEGFAIWGAITGSIGAINTVKLWIQELRAFVKEVKEAADTLRKFSVQYETCQADLEGWRDMYGLDEKVSTKYEVELWGKRQRDAVVGCLELVNSTSGDIQKIFAAFWTDLETMQNSGKGKKRKDNPQKMKLDKTLQFVISQSSDLQKKMTLIKEQIVEMKSISKSAFSRKHDKTITGDYLPTATLEEFQQSVLFQLAYETRLYQSCYAASKMRLADMTSIKDIKLEMDLFRRGEANTTTAISKEVIALQYQLLVVWPRRLLEFLVEGPLNPTIDPSQYNSSDQDFYGACMKALAGESGNFQVQTIADATWFHSIVPPETRRITHKKTFDENELKPLSTLLYDLNTPIAAEPTDRFPRSERINLAFKIVECGLFLSGTSWLSGLKSRLIQRSRRGIESERRFLLETSAPKAQFSDSDFRDFAKHAFAIGALLTEIGTGRLIHDIPPPSKTHGQGFSLFPARTGPRSDPIPFTGSRINDLLVVAMGDEYAKAVNVCLDSKESWKRARHHTAEGRADVYKKALADYYSEVFLP